MTGSTRADVPQGGAVAALGVLGSGSALLALVGAAVLGAAWWQAVVVALVAGMVVTTGVACGVVAAGVAAQRRADRQGVGQLAPEPVRGRHQPRHGVRRA